MGALFGGDVRVGIANERDRRDQADTRDHGAAHPDHSAGRDSGGEKAGEERGGRHAEVTG